MNSPLSPETVSCGDETAATAISRSEPSSSCCLHDLPEELIIHTLTFLDASTVAAVTRVSQYFKAIATPILYWNILLPSSTEGLNSQNTTARLIRTLVHRPCLVRYIHSIDNLPITLHRGFVSILFASGFTLNKQSGPRQPLNLLPPDVPQQIMSTCENLRYLSIDAQEMCSVLKAGGEWLRFLLDPKIRLRSLVIKGRPTLQDGRVWDDFASAVLIAQSELEYLDHPGLDCLGSITGQGDDPAALADLHSATSCWVPKLRTLKGTHVSIFRCLLSPKRTIEEVGFLGISMAEIDFRLVDLLKRVPTITTFSCHAQAGPRMDLTSLFKALPSLRHLRLAILLRCSYSEFFRVELPRALEHASSLEQMDLRDTTSEVDGTELFITAYTGPHPRIVRTQQCLVEDYAALAPCLRSVTFPDERRWYRRSVDSQWEKTIV